MFHCDPPRQILFACFIVGVISGPPWRSAAGAQVPCVGDCGNDGRVTVDEILTMVNIALGNTQVSDCTAGDANQDGQVTVDEILTAVNNALSGLDVRSENAAIQEALVGQHCVQHESLTICPAAETGATPSPSAATSTPTPSSAPPEPTATPHNTFTPGGVPTATASPASSAAVTPTPSPTPTATATATSSVQQVEVDIDPRVSVPCVSAQGGGCVFVLPFTVNGFSPAATFRVAVRTVNPNGRWVISDVLVPSGPAASAFEAPVDISTATLCCETAVQAAILAFFNPPAGVPAEVDELADTGAAEAFVTEPFTVHTG